MTTITATYKTITVTLTSWEPESEETHVGARVQVTGMTEADSAAAMIEAATIAADPLATMDADSWMLHPESTVSEWSLSSMVPVGALAKARLIEESVRRAAADIYRACLIRRPAVASDAE